MRHTRNVTPPDKLAPVGHLAAIMQDYVHPHEILRDDRLDVAEKRAVLCFWASDACAVESHPSFRWLPGTPGPILFDHIIAALKALDRRSHSSRSKGARTGAWRHPAQDSHAGA